MGQEQIFMQMEISMLVSSKMINVMVRELIHGQVVINTLVAISMIKDMVKGPLLLLMETNMLVNSEMVNLLTKLSKV